jgi:hypothetical protein
VVEKGWIGDADREGVTHSAREAEVGRTGGGGMKIEETKPIGKVQGTRKGLRSDASTREVNIRAGNRISGVESMKQKG